MRPLYEIMADITKLIDLETGEVLDTEALDALLIEKKQKIRNVAFGIKNLEGELEMVKAEAKKFNDRAKTISNTIAGLKVWMQNALGGEEFDDQGIRVKYRTSQSCRIVDATKVPTLWQKEQEIEYRKSDMLKALKSGEEIPGVEIEEKQNLQIKYLL